MFTLNKYFFCGSYVEVFFSDQVIMMNGGEFCCSAQLGQPAETASGQKYKGNSTRANHLMYLLPLAKPHVFSFV